MIESAKEVFSEYKVEKICDWYPELQLKKNNILDFGCGDGTMTKFIAKYFYNSKIVGFDTSKKKIEIARAKVPNVDFFSESFFQNFQENSFDLIIASQVFHHILIDLHKDYFNQIKKLLKSGGVFILLEIKDVKNCNGQALTLNDYLNNFNFEKTKVIHFGFFLKKMKSLRFLENYLSWLPLGNLFSIHGF